MVVKINYQKYFNFKSRLTPFLLCFGKDSDPESQRILDLMISRCNRYKYVECYILDWEEYRSKSNTFHDEEYTVKRYGRKLDVKIIKNVNKEKLNKQFSLINKLCCTDKQCCIGLQKARIYSYGHLYEILVPKLTTEDEYNSPPSETDDLSESSLNNSSGRSNIQEKDDTVQRRSTQDMDQGSSSGMGHSTSRQVNPQTNIHLQTSSFLPHHAPHQQLNRLEHTIQYQQYETYTDPYSLFQQREHQPRHLIHRPIPLRATHSYNIQLQSTKYHPQSLLNVEHQPIDPESTVNSSGNSNNTQTEARAVFDLQNPPRSPPRLYRHSIDDILGSSSPSSQKSMTACSSSSLNTLSTSRSATSTSKTPPISIVQQPHILTSHLIIPKTSFIPASVIQLNKFQPMSQNRELVPPSVSSTGKLQSVSHSSTRRDHTPYVRSGTHSRHQTLPITSNTVRTTQHIIHPRLAIPRQTLNQQRRVNRNGNNDRTSFPIISVDQGSRIISTRRSRSPNRRTPPQQSPHHY